MNCKKKILFISHDASRTGAPMILLHLIRWLKKNTTIKIYCLFLDGGDMLKDFEDLSSVFLWNPYLIKKRISHRLYSKITGRVINTTFPPDLSKVNFDAVFANTVASTTVLPHVKKVFKCPILLHVHENEYTIKNFYPNSLNKEITSIVDHYIAVSESTQKNLVDHYSIDLKKINLVHEFINLKQSRSVNITSSEIKKRLNITDEFVIGGAGLTSWRKGVDLFLQTAAKLNADYPKKYKFVWVGSIILDFNTKLSYEMERLGLNERDIIFTGQVEDPQNYLQVFDLFFLSSREDPFPLVCLEAAALKKPIICFDKAGGMPELVSGQNGATIKYGDIQLACDKIVELSTNSSLLRNMGEQISQEVQKFDVAIQVPKILEIIEKTIRNGT
jgi:glycosyltransferase involved in cell wall biosynthesis